MAMSVLNMRMLLVITKKTKRVMASQLWDVLYSISKSPIPSINLNMVIRV